ncbi:MAG: hypothetical protein RR523_04790 [Cetobacterium sp.]|uniref:hypothetical protein n=1 Tax=Cetobacterium sp. TaxID=2071632 RepID=UPI002FC7ED32
MKKILIILVLFFSLGIKFILKAAVTPTVAYSYSKTKKKNIENLIPEGLPEFPEEEIELPFLPDGTEEDENSNRRLEKNFTVFLNSKVSVFVPLEIISDIEVNAVIIDEEEVSIPIEIELNRAPEKKDYYKLKFSETEIDIDKDGKIDTFIYSTPFINKKIIDDVIVNIKGKNISKEGDFNKKIYITIEVDY